jgi:hypothetical protein
MSITLAANGTATITGTDIGAYRLLSLKSMLRMESKGMKSRGGALRPRIAEELGLKPRDSYEVFIAKIEFMVFGNR